MMRRMMLALLFTLWLAPSAWPKMKEDEQQYFDEHFKAVVQQMQDLTAQLQTLNAQLQALLKNQAQFQEAIARQQRSIQDLYQTVTRMQVGSEENASSLKTAISQLRKETQAAFVKLSGGSVAPPTGGGEPGPSGPSPATPAQGYVLSVEGNIVTLETSALTGIHQGSHLVLYKSTDPTTRVGVLEVTQVMDGGKSQAQVVSLNNGVQLEFSDVVRLE